ncbi:MAG: metallophosphoesterase [Candidatus Buchananbacteria bacterium]|jgi:hypothetical protein
MLKYLLLADGHFSNTLCPQEIEAIVRTASRLLGKGSSGAKKIARYYDDKRLTHMAGTFKQAGSCGPFDGLISLGDNFYDWENFGLGSAGTAEEARELKHRLLDYLSLHGKQHIWVPGNHELGYLNSSLSPRGPSLPAADNYYHYRDVYGPTCGIKRLNDCYSMIWISTANIENLFAYPDTINDEKNIFLAAQEDEELEFLSWTLDHLKGKFFLAVHDPGSFLSPKLAMILDNHIGKLAGSFCGHFHADWLLKLAKIYRQDFRNAFQLYKIQFIPSIWGVVLPFLFKTSGAGWARLDIDDKRAELWQYRSGIKDAKRFVL